MPTCDKHEQTSTCCAFTPLVPDPPERNELSLLFFFLLRHFPSATDHSRRAPLSDSDSGGAGSQRHHLSALQRLGTRQTNPRRVVLIHYGGQAKGLSRIQFDGVGSRVEVPEIKDTFWSSVGALARVVMWPDGKELMEDILKTLQMHSEQMMDGHTRYDTMGVQSQRVVKLRAYREADRTSIWPEERLDG